MVVAGRRLDAQQESCPGGFRVARTLAPRVRRAFCKTRYGIWQNLRRFGRRACDTRSVPGLHGAPRLLASHRGALIELTTVRLLTALGLERIQMVSTCAAGRVRAPLARTERIHENADERFAASSMMVYASMVARTRVRSAADRRDEQQHQMSISIR